MSAMTCPACLSSSFESGICKQCGYKQGKYTAPQTALPMGSEIGPYRIGIMKTSSRQSQIYTGIHSGTSNGVIIEEFFPQRMVGRAPGNPTVVLVSKEPEKETRFQQGCMQIEASEQKRPLKRVETIRANNTVYSVFEVLPNLPIAAQCEALADYPVCFRDGNGKPRMSINLLDIPPMPQERRFNPGQIDNKALDTQEEEISKEQFFRQTTMDAKDSRKYQPKAWKKWLIIAGCTLVSLIVLFIAFRPGGILRPTTTAEPGNEGTAVTEEPVKTEEGTTEAPTTIPTESAEKEKPAVTGEGAEVTNGETPEPKPTPDVTKGSEVSPSEPTPGPTSSPEVPPTMDGASSEQSPKETGEATITPSPTDTMSPGKTNETNTEENKLDESIFERFVEHIYIMKTEGKVQGEKLEPDQENKYSWNRRDITERRFDLEEGKYKACSIDDKIIGQVGNNRYVAIQGNGEDKEKVFRIRISLDQKDVKVKILYKVTEEEVNEKNGLQAGDYIVLSNIGDWEKLQQDLINDPAAYPTIENESIHIQSSDGSGHQRYLYEKAYKEGTEVASEESSEEGAEKAAEEGAEKAPEEEPEGTPEKDPATEEPGEEPTEKAEETIDNTASEKETTDNDFPKLPFQNYTPSPDTKYDDIRDINAQPECKGNEISGTLKIFAGTSDRKVKDLEVYVVTEQGTKVPVDMKKKIDMLEKWNNYWIFEFPNETFEIPNGEKPLRIEVTYIMEDETTIGPEVISLEGGEIA